MIALWLIVAHMAGDFLLQDRWEAAGKIADRNLRARHVLKYGACFVPVAVVYHRPNLYGGVWPGQCALLFLFGLMLLHERTDSRRFLSTPGDWLTWRFTRRWTIPTTETPFVEVENGMVTLISQDETGERRHRGRIVDVWPSGRFVVADMDLQPNPWPPILILIDQALHLLQIAVLAAVFLSG